MKGRKDNIDDSKRQGQHKRPNTNMDIHRQVSTQHMLTHHAYVKMAFFKKDIYHVITNLTISGWLKDMKGLTGKIWTIRHTHRSIDSHFMKPQTMALWLI